MGAEERGRHDGDTLQGFKSIYRLRNVPTRLPLVYPPRWFGLPAMFKRCSTASGVVTTFGFPAIVVARYLLTVGVIRGGVIRGGVIAG
jgi:hypothetical protein